MEASLKKRLKPVTLPATFCPRPVAALRLDIVALKDS
jgi:hypothetical protein